MLEQAVKQTAAAKLMAYYALWLTHLGEAYLLAGRIEDACQYARQALELAHDSKQMGYEAYALRLLGEIAGHHVPPDIDQATAHYRQALALAEELGMRPLQARCHFALGELAKQAGETRDAQEQFEKAASMFRDMGMQSWLEKAEAALKDL